MSTSFSGPVVVYYHPALGRAGAIIRMLDYAGVPYEHVSSFPDSLCGAFGSATGTTFAPPVVSDGDFAVSQSTAATLYVGKMTGLTSHLSDRDEFKLVQYIADCVDFFEPTVNAAKAKGAAFTKTHLEGSGDGAVSRFSQEVRACAPPNTYAAR